MSINLKNAKTCGCSRGQHQIQLISCKLSTVCINGLFADGSRVKFVEHDLR